MPIGPKFFRVNGLASSGEAGGSHTCPLRRTPDLSMVTSLIPERNSSRAGGKHQIVLGVHPLHFAENLANRNENNVW